MPKQTEFADNRKIKKVVGYIHIDNAITKFRVFD